MQTLFIGKNLIFLPEIPSTNSYAIDLLKNVKPTEGTVVYTANQTQGRGQRGALWQAENGQNITCSIILKPTFLELHQQFFLYQISALACYDTITELLPTSQIDIKIKWPNDILLEMKKVSGILIENSIQHNQLIWSVIGIGMNINQHLFSPELKATSLSLIGKRNFETSEVLKLLLANLEKHYLILRQSKFDETQSRYLQRLFGVNEFYEYKLKDKITTLKIVGLCEDGLLILEDKAGKKLKTDVKEAQLMY